MRARTSTHDDGLQDGALQSNSLGSSPDDNMQAANERAWLTLEIMLAGKCLYEHTAENDSSFSQRLRDAVDLLLEQVAPDEFRRSDSEWRQACWQQLRAAHQAGLLELNAPNLQELAGPHGERQTVIRLCEAFERSAWYCLRPLVEMRSPHGSPLFLALLQWFAQKALEPAEEPSVELREWDRALEIVVELIEAHPGRLEMVLRAACMTTPGAVAQPVVDSMAASLRFQRGLGCIQNGEYERAIVEFGAAIQHNSGMEHAYAQRGDAHRMLGSYDRALADYTAALRINPVNLLVLLNRGQTSRMLGRQSAAVADYDLVLQLDANNVVALNHRGSTRAEMGSHDEAISDFTEALRIDSEYPFSYQNRARSYAARGDLDLAIADYGQVLRLNPMFTLAYVRRGDAYRQKGELSRAVADYTEALRLDPLHLHAFVNRGAAYQEQGQSNRAMSDFEAALKLDAANPRMFLSRGIAHRDNGDFSRALSDFDAAMRLNPDNHQIYFHRALAHQEMGDSESALLDLDEAIRRKPDAADAYFHRGSLFLTQRDQESAISDLTESIRLEPANKRAFLSRALAHSLNDDFDLVIEDCNRAIDHDASLKPAFMTRGIAFHRKRRYEDALADFERVLLLAPTDAEALINQGVVYAKMGRHDAAITGLTRALKLAPENARQLAARAASYRTRDRLGAALADYAHAIQLDPRHSVAFCNQRGLVHLLNGERELALADCALSLYLEPDNRRALNLREQIKNSTAFEFDPPPSFRTEARTGMLPSNGETPVEASSTLTMLEDTLGQANTPTESEIVLEEPAEPAVKVKQSERPSRNGDTEFVELFVDERVPAPASTRASSLAPTSETDLVVTDSDSAEYEKEQRLFQENLEREKAAKDAVAQARLADQRREEAAKIFKQNQEKEAQRLARLNAKARAQRDPADASVWMRRAAVAGLTLFLLYLVGPTIWSWVMKPSYPQEEKEILTAEAKLSAAELSSRFQNDAASAQAEFGGRVLEVSGRVKDVAGEGNDYVIVLMDEKKEGRIMCKMLNPKSVPQGNLLSKIDRLGMVTLKGKCTGQESDKIKLDGVQARSGAKQLTVNKRTPSEAPLFPVW